MVKSEVFLYVKQQPESSNFFLSQFSLTHMHYTLSNEYTDRS